MFINLAYVLIYLENNLRIFGSQIYEVSSSFRSEALFCSCPYNYNHAIYKGVSCLFTVHMSSVE